MNCKEYTKWIMEGAEFLSEDDKNNLDKHLKACSTCQELYHKISSDNDFINKLSKIMPELTYPDAMTADIMREIDKSTEKLNLKTILIKILDFAFSLKVRSVAYSLVITFIVLFAYQQHFIINKLENIEQTVETQSDKGKSATLGNNRIIKQLTKAGSEKQISVDKDDLDFFLETYEDLKTDHDKLIKVINNNMHLLENKLSKEDLDKLRKVLDSDLENLQTSNL